MNSPLSSTVVAQYDALTSGIGVAILENRTQIELTGADRASFLHNLCTNDVKARAPGEGCEAFFCDARGKIVGFTNIFVVLPESIVVDYSCRSKRSLAQPSRSLFDSRRRSIDPTVPNMNGPCYCYASGPACWTMSFPALLESQAATKPFESSRSQLSRSHDVQIRRSRC